MKEKPPKNKPISMEGWVRDGLTKKLAEHFDGLEEPIIDTARERFNDQDIDLLRRKSGAALIPSFISAIPIALEYPECFSMKEIISCMEMGRKPEDLKRKPFLTEYPDNFNGLDRIALSDAKITPKQAGAFHKKTFGRFTGNDIAAFKEYFHKKGVSFEEMTDIIKDYPSHFNGRAVYILLLNKISAKKSKKLSDRKLKSLNI